MSRFIDHISRFYGINSIPFFPGTLEEAQTQTLERIQYLVLYLHSPLHSNTKRFIAKVLADDEVTAQFSDEASVLLGVSVLDPLGHSLADKMQITTYPAIIVLFKNRVLMKLQGEFETAEEFLREWKLCRDRWDGAVAEEISFRTEKQRREDSIREEREKEEELERKDRELLARLVAEQEEKKRLAEEKRIAEEKEKEAARIAQQKEQQREVEREKSKEKAATLLPPEPPEDGDKDSMVHLSVRSLSGVNRLRRFRREEKVELLRLWARSFEDDDPLVEISFVTGFPPSVIEWDPATTTFGEVAALCPRAAVIIRKAQT